MTRETQCEVENKRYKIVGQKWQRWQSVERACTRGLNRWRWSVRSASPFAPECEAFCISASPRQPHPPTRQSRRWLIVVHTNRPHGRIHISRLEGSEFFFFFCSEILGRNYLSVLAEIPEKQKRQKSSRGCHRWGLWHSRFRHVCLVHGLPRWYDLLRRHMIQTNKSTPLPHNSLSLRLLSSSSCCHQPSSFTHTHAHTHTHMPSPCSSFAKEIK